MYYYIHSYLIYSMCKPLKVIVRRDEIIMLNLNKIPTYLLKLKLIGRITANKYILRKGLIKLPECSDWSALFANSRIQVLSR